LRTPARQRLSLSLKGAFAKNRDGFLGRDFAPLGPLMDDLILGVWNVALVHEAAEDASGIAGFFGWGTGVFRCLTHEAYSLGQNEQLIVRSHAHHFNLPTQSVIESLPVFSAARAMPDLPTLIFSAYCNGMRGDFQPPA
jgi:hypothetical protein